MHSVQQWTNVKHGGELWTNPQLLRRYYRHLTLDPNTASRTLALSKKNRKVTRLKYRTFLSYPEHPDRFDDEWDVVRCAESLAGRSYWEVETTDGVYLGVTYRGEGIGLGMDAAGESQCLYCSHDCYVIIDTLTDSSVSAEFPFSKRLGMYVDSPAGTLSFYDVSSDDTLTHLYTYQCEFTEPIYAGFRPLYQSASVRLVDVNQ